MSKSSVKVKCISVVVKSHNDELDSSRFQQSNGLQDGVVPEPGGAGPVAAALSARRQQAGQFVARGIGVTDDLVGLPPALLGVEVSVSEFSFSSMCALYYDYLINISGCSRSLWAMLQINEQDCFLNNIKSLYDFGISVISISFGHVFNLMD